MNKAIASFLLGLSVFSFQTQIIAKDDLSHVAGKAWAHENKKLFDIFLRSNPITLFRIQKSSNTIKETVTALKTTKNSSAAQETEFVKAQLNKSLELVKPFIDDIRGYKDLIEPLLKESLAHHNAKDLYLVKFFNTADSKEKLETFTDREIRTVAQLQNMLHELQGFFADLFASLSKETKDAYKAFLSKNAKH
jgi:hypothetical protein